MRKMRALVGVLLLAACAKQAAQPQQEKGSAWDNGESVSSDGARLDIICINGEWPVTVRTIERLVPPSASRQWVNRDVTYQFDGEPAQQTKGTLNESRLDFTQSEEGSVVNLNYGQDVAAGLMRENHKTLTISTTDGANRPKIWRFDVTDSSGNIPNNSTLPCPISGNTNSGKK